MEMRADPRSRGELAGAELGTCDAVDATIPWTEIAVGTSSRLGPSAVAGNDAPAWIACQRSRNIGVSRSSSAQSASSLDVAGSIGVASVAAIRNLAGRRFSATSRYQDRLSRIAESSQIFKSAKSLMKGLPAAKRSALN
jgi:hypothetical protein